MMTRLKSNSKNRHVRPLQGKWHFSSKWSSKHKIPNSRSPLQLLHSALVRCWPFFYPKSIFAIYERPLINVVQYVWCEVGSACLRVGLFLYRDLILFLIFGNLILTAIITCMVPPRLSFRRWRWWAPWCSSWRATRSQSSTAFETGAHAESPPVDPVISDNDDDIYDIYDDIDDDMMMIICPNKFGPLKLLSRGLETLKRKWQNWNRWWNMYL